MASKSRSTEDTEFGNCTDILQFSKVQDYKVGVQVKEMKLFFFSPVLFQTKCVLDHALVQCARQLAMLLFLFTLLLDNECYLNM